MTIFFTRTFQRASFCMLFLISLSSVAQENFTAYWQPSIAVNYDVTSRYSNNFSIQNRNYIYDNETTEFSIRQIDVSHYSNLRIRDNQSVAFGILYRFRENFDGGNNELRLTQQYNLQYKPYVVRYGHRLRSEQRVTSSKTTHRFRYRFSLDFPLQGEKLDIGEPYFVGNFENLLSATKEQEPQYDVRLTLNFGWKLSEKTKLQVGSEYRLEDYSQDLEQVLFFLSTLNISL
ncbi:hypothetical protein MTsPCn9_18520 [Croceitalea sp. MTPC9]|uniref:DUF2490 domain-containing protein n=1 Tax=unclassified Croceitalea TaxID=2632280 RepID=UPI002B3A6C3C|nr:hypothetical protein MTsPCn6_11370 [Croceitalea sp. MTPC6]GMN16916.1 hypothetical protein MTsPCn9_18520 [Croceitalea sp. MTPC9]